MAAKTITKHFKISLKSMHIFQIIIDWQYLVWIVGRDRTKTNVLSAVVKVGHDGVEI